MSHGGPGVVTGQRWRRCSKGRHTNASCVDLGDVMALVLHKFVWLVLQLSIDVTAHARSDRM